MCAAIPSENMNFVLCVSLEETASQKSKKDEDDVGFGNVCDSQEWVKLPSNFQFPQEMFGNKPGLAVPGRIYGFINSTRQEGQKFPVPNYKLVNSH